MCVRSGCTITPEQSAITILAKFWPHAFPKANTQGRCGCTHRLVKNWSIAGQRPRGLHASIARNPCKCTPNGDQGSVHCGSNIAVWAKMEETYPVGVDSDSPLPVCDRAAIPPKPPVPFPGVASWIKCRVNDGHTLNASFTTGFHTLYTSFSPVFAGAVTSSKPHACPIYYQCTKTATD
jgi:hypothetical protein